MAGSPLPSSTTACVVGGGPAGIMLGLLLARAAVDVVVLEKHADFLRDFRGDTVHPSTMTVLDEIGLGERFERLPHQKVTRALLHQADQAILVADFGQLPGRHPYVAMVPQWDFLTFLATEAARYPTFHLWMRAEAYDVLWDADRVAGVRVRDPSGEHEVRAALTVAADGRDSTIRRAVGARPREFGVPMDVLWFRLSRRPDDPRAELTAWLSPGQAVVLIPRPTYWQVAYVIRKGGYEDVRSAGVAALRERLTRTVPFLSDRADEITSLADDTRVLRVRMNRLRRWHQPGLLFIGDAAHAMSPVGGLGINLAIHDAVAAANRLADPLRRHQETGTAVSDAVLAAIARRRRVPTVITQWFQRVVQRVGLQRALNADSTRFQIPGAVLPVVRPVLSRVVGLGVIPEHVRI
ncbi:FAD-dependent oxidoreductase [Thermasporomyces composti]|jgi:2-polyprenyl-6-methoxyphenol hydroxylase-like FAD-dependent oxidoreductase|uniref:2-polyprenyl-6-methoxyphenol hydroxylase-like FAD-dependent oxidoreductase n=1 Tax=Thermasporomyces composti TaxID=696763 RepID=A0A3D9V371_THECX|nr:FAD-dependent oxidoreductase [Thermasporomyces composti]REF35836.1 2-polyprenyl-6-methoxyphenol hydroxylase-like FAD-dependent oxidoreductase [Thermasporomyces composti]